MPRTLRASHVGEKLPRAHAAGATLLKDVEAQKLLQQGLEVVYQAIRQAQEDERAGMFSTLREFTCKVPETFQTIDRLYPDRTSGDGDVPRDATNSPERTRSPTVVETGLKRKRGRISRKKVTESDFGDITLSISETCTATDLTRIRTSFYTDLREVLKKDPKAEELALDFTSFFFEDVMGRNSLDRLVRFCRGYSGVNGKEMDVGAVRRLKVLAADTTTPVSIRRFYSALYTQETHRTHKNALVQHLDQLIYARKFSHEYRSLQEKLEREDTDLMNFLIGKGFEVRIGHGWTSLALDYLVQQSGVTRTSFSNTHERAKGVDELVKFFGEGILPLLPPGSMNRLRRLGNARMRPAYELLQKHVSSFQPVCDVVREHIYQPFVAGADQLPIMAGALAVPHDVPLLQALRQAVDQSHDDGQTSSDEL